MGVTSLTPVSVLRKFLCPEVIFGAGSACQLDRVLTGFSVRRVLLVSDEGLAASGWPQAIRDQLTQVGIEPVSFTDVSVNPRTSECAAGARRYAEHRCQALVALGGGSVIDAAKGIGVLVANGGTFLPTAASAK